MISHYPNGTDVYPADMLSSLVDRFNVFERMAHNDAELTEKGIDLDHDNLIPRDVCSALIEFGVDLREARDAMRHRAGAK